MRVAKFLLGVGVVVLANTSSYWVDAIGFNLCRVVVGEEGGADCPGASLR